MGEFFTKLWQQVVGLPIYGYLLIGAALVAVVILVVALVRRTRILRLAYTLMDTGETDETLRKKLLARPRLVETLVRRHGDTVIAYYSVADHLIRKVETRPLPDDVGRLLALAPEEGLFVAFKASLKKESLAGVFRSWLAGNPDILVLRNIALSGRGRDFDGVAARRLLAGRIEEVRELSGDPEWPVRYFSLQVLLGDESEKSMRLLKEAFTDPHPLIRKTISQMISVVDIDDLFSSLLTLVLDDPVPEVRAAARERIDGSFPERWTIDPGALNALQYVHVLELLKVESKEDENIAVTALGGKEAEARLAAGRFLDKSGALKRMFLTADRGDREEWDRRRGLLENAVSVNVDGFLSGIRDSDTTGVLLLAAKILEEGGSARWIAPLAEKVFRRGGAVREADESDLYRTTMIVACTRGDEPVASAVRDELRRRKHDEDILSFTLPILPPDEVGTYRKVLLDFLHDPEFPADEAYLSLMGRLPPAIFLEPVLDILESERSAFPHVVRLRALKTLGVWRLDYTLQTILENLPVLPLEEARDFAENLAALDRKSLEERAAFIIGSPDAGVRAALISCLPAAGIKSFTKEIREGLNDADPDVRIACLRALLDSGELKAAGSAMDLLRDPVERVRRESARLAGTKGGPKFVQGLGSVLVDRNEVVSVRIAALEGLSAGDGPEALETLITFLDTGEDLRDETAAAMASKTKRRDVVALIEFFKDAKAVLRERIADVFAAMGEAGEGALVNLLHEDIASLRPFLADILTRTGFVESLVRKLNHRKPQVRRDAATLLAEIGSETAYRGIILASRDPDKEVRIRVTKALEALNTAEGAKILQSLEEDPDRKVRKYTHWAMERVRAKNL